MRRIVSDVTYEEPAELILNENDNEDENATQEHTNEIIQHIDTITPTPSRDASGLKRFLFFDPELDLFSPPMKVKI